MTTVLPSRISSGYSSMPWTKSKPPPQPASSTVRISGRASRPRKPGTSVDAVRSLVTSGPVVGTAAQPAAAHDLGVVVAAGRGDDDAAIEADHLALGDE